MLEPYKMIYMNIASLFVIGCLLLFYIKIYPKKLPTHFSILLLLSIPPVISIFRLGTYESGDLSMHAKFAMEFFQSIAEGNIFPQWAKYNCLSYGCPNFLYMYPFPYYFISLIHLLGLSFISSIKAYLIITYIMSGIFIFYWIKDEINARSGLIAGVFYLYAPYHLLDLHYRVTIAEMASFMLLPLAFLSVKKLFYSLKIRWILALTTTTALLILSHQAIVTTAIPILLAYSALKYYKNKNKLSLIFSFIFISFGFLITIDYWGSVLFEKSYILYGVRADVFFPKIQEFIYTPWRFGLLLQGPEGQLSFILGYVQIVLVISSIYIFKKYGFGKNNPLYIFSITFFILIFILMQSFSRPIWEITPLLKSFQFSYRLLVLVAFFISIIAAILSTRIKSNKVYYLLITITILSTILNWGNRRVIPVIDDGYLRAEFKAGNPGLGDLTTPIWVDLENPKKYTLKKTRLELIDGSAKVKQIDDKVNYHSYIVNVQDYAIFRENTFYYPNWNVYVNGKRMNVDFQKKDMEGTMVFSAPKGISLIEVKFENSEIRNILIIISQLSLIILIVTLLFIRKIKF